MKDQLDQAERAYKLIIEHDKANGVSSKCPEVTQQVYEGLQARSPELINQQKQND